MGALESTAIRQAGWSNTANGLKAKLDRYRWSTLVLSVLGALLAAIASQIPVELPTHRAWVAIAGAVSLAIATFLTARFGGPTSVSNWARARQAAEALKREGFKFAARAAPYDDPATADDLLNQERKATEDVVDYLIDKFEKADKVKGVPVATIAADEYIAKRVQGQIDYYENKAEDSRVIAGRLRNAEFALALLATILTAVVGVLPKYPLTGLAFDFAAITAVLTTIGAAILSHIEAARYDFIVLTYRAAARHLRDAWDDLKGVVPGVPSKPWSEFVERCEAIIAAENNSWVAKWSGKTQP
jgi:hypothetical protein